jgi:hypothetical protein
MAKSVAAAVTFAILVVSCASGSGEGSRTGPTETSGTMVGMDVHRSVAPSPIAAAKEREAYPGGDADGVPANGPPAAVVPDVQGMAFAAAVRRLRQTGIGVELILGRESHAAAWTVIEQDPVAGSDTPASGEINLILSLHHVGGAEVMGIVECRPDLDRLGNPRCLGKLFKY